MAAGLRICARTCTAAVLLLVAVASATAAPFVVSTGLAGNTYDTMFKQLSDQCQTKVGSPFIGKPSSGSVENIERLLNNDVVAAIVQTDVLHFRARTDDMNRFKVLFALYPEEVHVVALKERKVSGIVEKVLDMFRGPTIYASLADLRDRKVGAWGGSYITAQNMRLQSNVPFSVTELPNQIEATAALERGELDAVFAVGGSPLGWVQSLDSRFKLLSIGDAEVAKLKGVYRLARVSYARLAATGIQTVSTDALMVTRDYRSTEMVSLLAKVRACFRSSLQELREQPGNHAKWDLVDPLAMAKWPMYEPPTAAPRKAPARPKK